MVVYLRVRRHVLMIEAIASLMTATAIVAACIVTASRPWYVERNLGYYRGPAAQVYQGLDQAYWQGPIVYVHIRRIAWTYSGQEGLAQFHADHPPRARWFYGRTARRAEISQRPRQSLAQKLGFGFYRYDLPFAVLLEHHTVVTAPAWLAAAPLAVFGGLVLWKQWRFRRWQRTGRCPVCGYDLRATPGRCPECGWTPLPAPSAPPAPHDAAAGA